MGIPDVTTLKTLLRMLYWRVPLEATFQGLVYSALGQE
jgi:hypothetical protein